MWLKIIAVYGYYLAKINSRRANKRLFQPSGVPAIHYISCLVVRTRQEDAVPIRTKRKIEAFLPTVMLRFLELYIQLPKIISSFRIPLI